jgi:hypothetical protein
MTAKRRPRVLKQCPGEMMPEPSARCRVEGMQKQKKRRRAFAKKGKPLDGEPAVAYQDPVMQECYALRCWAVNNPRLSVAAFEGWMGRWLRQRHGITWAEWLVLVSERRTNAAYHQRLDQIRAALAASVAKRMGGGLSSFRSHGSGQTPKS